MGACMHSDESKRWASGRGLALSGELRGNRVLDSAGPSAPQHDGRPRAVDVKGPRLRAEGAR